ncbi:DUF687 family protein [Candidatus Chlamydia sanziniae]|uniref:Transmembrane protein n=1 Tax=Candidatus Chlamydia sanziniae TaxID=1806891 RepID=A0A1A9HUL3_9CHLA|nr:DUF687 family protein [Candidatus Chlamydia sanziniae]ANH78679.1 hypothetical protein Cs308_0509 [Candidatus Chlamydia sanziniae]
MSTPIQNSSLSDKYCSNLSREYSIDESPESRQQTNEIPTELNQSNDLLSLTRIDTTRASTSDSEDTISVSSPVPQAPIFHAIYNSNVSTPVSTPLVGIGYINGSQSGYFDTQNEALYLSQLLGGREVIVVQNRGGGVACPLFCQTQIENSPMCRALLDIWEEFFTTHPEGSIFMQYFFGNGAIYIRASLCQTPYVNSIVLVGICPSVYPEHHRALYYRVLGDLPSRMDCQGFLRSGVVTLPYSSGSFGIFWISFRDPAFSFAILNAFMQTAGVSVVSQRMAGSPVSESMEMVPLRTSFQEMPQEEESVVGIVGYEMGGVSLVRTSSPNIFTRIHTWLHTEVTVADLEENPLPPDNILDRLTELAVIIVRISDAVSIIWFFSLVDTIWNASSIAVCMVFFGFDGVCSCFLMLTNPHSRRERFRNLRIIALFYRSLGAGMNALDLINNLRLAARPTVTPCTAALYGVTSIFGWTLLAQDILTYVFPGIRDAFYRCCFRWRSSTFEQARVQNIRERVVVLRQNQEAFYDVSSIINIVIYGIFFALVGIATTFGGLEISPSCRFDSTTNETDNIFLESNVTFTEALLSGRVYAVSQVTHMIFCFVSMVFYIGSLFRILRSNY